eukprot:RCo046934
MAFKKMGGPGRRPEASTGGRAGGLLGESPLALDPYNPIHWGRATTRQKLELTLLQILRQREQDWAEVSKALMPPQPPPRPRQPHRPAKATGVRRPQGYSGSACASRAPPQRPVGDAPHCEGCRPHEGECCGCDERTPSRRIPMIPSKRGQCCYCCCCCCHDSLS